MEFGLIKVNNIQPLSFAPFIQNLPVLVNVNDKFNTFSCSVKQLKSPDSELVIKSLQKSQQDVRINSSDCTKTILVNEGTIHPKISVSLFYNRESFQQMIKSEDFHFNVESKQYHLMKAQVREKNLPILKIMRFKPSSFPRTDEALKTLENFLMHYKNRVEKLEFIGYYHSVPIQSARRYVIMNKDLVLELSDKKSKRVDLFVFKSSDEYLFQVVSEK